MSPSLVLAARLLIGLLVPHTAVAMDSQQPNQPNQPTHELSIVLGDRHGEPILVRNTLLVERVVADLAQAREVDASGGPGPSIPPLMTTVKVVVKGIDHSFQIDDGCTVVHPLATGGLRYIDQSHSEGLRAILVMRGAYRTLVDRKK